MPTYMLTLVVKVREYNPRIVLTFREKEVVMIKEEHVSGCRSADNILICD